MPGAHERQSGMLRFNGVPGNALASRVGPFPRPLAPYQTMRLVPRVPALGPFWRALAPIRGHLDRRVAAPARPGWGHLGPL